MLVENSMEQQSNQSEDTVFYCQNCQKEIGLQKNATLEVMRNIQTNFHKYDVKFEKPGHKLKRKTMQIRDGTWGGKLSKFETQDEFLKAYPKSQSKNRTSKMKNRTSQLG